MRKYPKYKSKNDNQWFDSVPDSWEIIALKHVSKYVKTGTTPSTKEPKYYENGEIDWFTPEDINTLILNDAKKKISLQALQDGEVKIFQKDSLLSIGIEATISKVGILAKNASSNQQINAIYFNKKVVPKFGLFYFLSIAKLINNFSSTSTMGIFNQSKTKAIYLPIPPLPEQFSIIRFLDHKTGQMDRFIANRQKQIELLKEQKAGIINKAVTKGLNSLVQLKDSGDYTLGKVPEHWEVLELKFVARMMRGKFSHRPRNDERLYGGIYPFIQTEDVTKTEKYITSYKQTLNDWGKSVSKMFPKGTVVITIAANIGDIAILDFDACFPDSIVGFFPKQNKTEYLFYLLKSMKEVFLSESIEGTQLNLSVDRLSSIKVAIPSPTEQQEIVDFILLETSNTEALISKYQKQIDLMQEYRTSIISQAVTGKIDVREWEPKAKKYKTEELGIEMVAEK